LGKRALFADSWAIDVGWSDSLQLDHRESDLSRVLGQLLFELFLGPVAERRMQTLGVMDLPNEPRQPLGDIAEGLVAADIDLLDFERLHEAINLRTVM
jgi:hypothetical protein